MGAINVVSIVPPAEPMATVVSPYCQTICVAVEAPVRLSVSIPAQLVADPAIVAVMLHWAEAIWVIKKKKAENMMAL
jgi:hypothetical protein